MNTAEFIRKLRANEVTEEDIEWFSKGMTKVAVEEALRVLPTIIDHVVKQTTILHRMAQNFYSKNPDLQKHRDLVVQTIEQVESDNPALSYEEVLKIAGPKVRDKLKKGPHVERPAKKPQLSEVDSSLGDL